MKLTVIAVVLIASLSLANVVVLPPLNSETIVGTWEASPAKSPTLWHMELNRDGKSYLVQVTVGASYIVRPLISSEIDDGKIRLHFGKGLAKDLPNRTFPELWVVGTGTGDGRIGTIQWGDDICFIKGTWTRDVAEASKTAQASVKAAELKFRQNPEKP